MIQGKPERLVLAAESAREANDAKARTERHHECII
jgi:hypothetical protein